MKHFLLAVAVAAVATTWATAGPFANIRSNMAERQAQRQERRAARQATTSCTQPAPTQAASAQPVQQAAFTHGTTYRGDWSAPPPTATEYPTIRLSSPLPVCVGPNCPK